MREQHSTWGIPTSFRSWRGLAALCLAAAFAACAQQPAAKTAPAAASPSAAAPSSSSTSAAAAKPVHRGEGMDPALAAQEKPAEPFKVQYPQPPDGKWLQDDQGRQYFEQEVPKVEGTYLWLDPEHTRVRLRYGETYDVASAGETSFKVKVYRVDQAGRPEGAAPAAPTAADRERIAAGYQSTLAKSDRLSFQPFNKGLPNEGQWRNGFDIADMNGDGHPDIVFSAQRKGRRVPNIFLGDGHGSWRLWTEVKFPPLAYDYGDAAVADFNGDGQPDLALGVHLRGILAIVSDGPGRFKEWGRGLDFQVPGNGQDASGFSSRAVAAVDWNGDGRPDIVALGEGPRFSNSERGSARPVRAYGMVVYLNQGDGSWKRLADSEDVLLFGDDLAVGDLDGDGHADAVLGSNVMGDRSLLRWGKGNDGWDVATLEEMRPDGYLRAVRIADFNQDGRPDMLIGYTSNELGLWRSGIDVLINLGGRKWQRQPVISEDTREGVFALGTGDLDADGKLDVAALTGNGDTWVFLGDGAGAFHREETPEIAEALGGCRGYGLRLVDLDGDGKDELVSAFAGEASAMFAPDHCPNQGSLTAWKPQPKTAESPAR